MPVQFVAANLRHVADYIGCQHSRAFSSVLHEVVLERGRVWMHEHLRHEHVLQRAFRSGSEMRTLEAYPALDRLVPGQTAERAAEDRRGKIDRGAFQPRRDETGRAGVV